MLFWLFDRHALTDPPENLWSLSVILWINPPDSAPSPSCCELRQPGNRISSAGSQSGCGEAAEKREVGTGFQGHFLAQFF